ncbi:Uu.00g020990.m01.CDS01 [Anthostomella pinea]|uniref:Uu.00g020990.m01.CDS01 n=1 Tax=Anthostomella pinea TaxID=933095 RepID=A0AAI8W0H8_9PEZI|nr:Uu.00g020990.m01.CDS01 [Anthostomella pinea]
MRKVSDKHEKEKEQLEGRVASLQGEVGTKDSELKQHTSQIVQLEAGIGEKTTKEAELQSENTRIQALQTENARILQEKKAAITNLNDEKRALEAENERLTQSCSDQEKRLQGHQAEMNELLGQIEDTSNTPHEATDLNQLRHELEKANSSISEKQTEIERLQTQVQALERQHNEKASAAVKGKDQAQALADADRINKLGEQLDKASANSTAHQSQVKTLEERVEGLQDNLENERKVGRLKREVEGKDQEVDEIQQQTAATIRDLNSKLASEEGRRRRVFEELQQMRGNIRVMCRIRPLKDENVKQLGILTKPSKTHGKPASLQLAQKLKNVAGFPKTDLTVEQVFERVFLPTESNDDVFVEIGQLLQSFLDGNKVCIFCYGKTGTGKTYTMCNEDNNRNGSESGTHKNDGIIPRATKMGFDEAAELQKIGWTVKLEGCCYEIYNHELYPLRSGKRKEKQLDEKHLEGRKNFQVNEPEFQPLNDLEQTKRSIEYGQEVSSTQ